MLPFELGVDVERPARQDRTIGERKPIDEMLRQKSSLCAFYYRIEIERAVGAVDRRCRCYSFGADVPAEKIFRRCGHTELSLPHGVSVDGIDCDDFVGLCCRNQNGVSAGRMPEERLREDIARHIGSKSWIDTHRPGSSQ